MAEKRVIIRDVEKGVTPKHLKEHTQRFGEAAIECSERLKETKLTGADKVTAFNECMSKTLRRKKEEEPE